MIGERRRRRTRWAGWWRRWAREYAAAAMLAAGMIAALPEGRLAHPVQIVRVRDRAGDDPFDPRERAGGNLVLTLPLPDRPERFGFDASPGPSLN